MYKKWILGLVSLAVLGSATAQDSAVEKKTPWEKSASLGVSLTSGNADTALFTGDIIADRKKGKNELSLGASAAYGENDNTTTSEIVEGFSQYNRLYSDRFFSYARVHALHNGVADVDYRLTLGPGAGYYFIKKEEATLSVEGGPTVIYEKLGSLDGQGFLSVRLGQKYTRKISDKARFWQNLEFLPQVDDLENYIVDFEVGLESQLSEKLSLRTVFQNLYDNQPAPGRKGNDMRLVTSIGYKF
jgi:putative salt-induced outer membrane protein YdiY